MRLDVTRYWYQRSLHPVLFLLLPFSYLFRCLTALRRFCYRCNLFATHSFAAPVIVVGNITVGGTGKTPFIIWLAAWLRARGYRPGIVCRGVGGFSHKKPYLVQATDLAKQVGDEALMLRQRTDCAVVVAIDRAAAVQYLLQATNCNIVLSDDGLQHYRMQRALEIVMVDGERRFGNGHLLPAGPLRETLTRLHEVDLTIVNGGNQSDPYVMQLIGDKLNAINSVHVFSLNEFPHKKVHAVAGIGHPERFFQQLTQAGFDVIPHRFPDHHAYEATDFNFNDDLPIFMTEKDAVKCAAFANARFWYVPVTATVNPELEQFLLAKLETLYETTPHTMCHSA